MTTLEEQIAEAEAEPESDEEEEPEAGEGEPEPDEEEEEADEPEAEAELPALTAIGPDEIKKAERAIAGQRRRLAGILGDEYVANECLLCTGVGFLPELPPVGVSFLVVEEEEGPALLAQPPQAALEYVQAKDKTACDWCAAQGFVLSGSKNPHADVVPCSKCQGNGWVIVAVPELAAVAPLALGEGRAPAQAPLTEGLGEDTWGRPPGHQHWGVPPAAIQG